MIHSYCYRLSSYVKLKFTWLEIEYYIEGVVIITTLKKSLMYHTYDYLIADQAILGSFNHVGNLRIFLHFVCF